MVKRTFKEIEIEIPGMTVRGFEAGPPDGAPVLALHGWLDNAAGFIPLCSHLPLGVRVLALDLPGHGFSDHRPVGAPYHFVDWVTVVMEVVDALGWDRFSLMGHSMGAGISSLVAGTFPERVGAVVFLEGLGPLAGKASEGPEDLREHILAGQRLVGRTIKPYPDKDAATQMLMAATGMARESALLLVERGLMEVEGGFFWRSDPRMRQRSALRLTEEQVHHYLTRITARAILVQAKDGFSFDGDWMRKRREAISGLVVCEVEGNHHMHMQNPAQVMTQIAPFLVSD